jgi:hypothetical protein
MKNLNTSAKFKLNKTVVTRFTTTNKGNNYASSSGFTTAMPLRTA